MHGLTSVFAINATSDEIESLLFRDVDVDEDMLDEGFYNTGIGELFGINFVEEDYFLKLSSREALPPEKFFALPHPDLAGYEFGKTQLAALCEKHRVLTLNSCFILGDTAASKATAGQKKPMGKRGSHVIYLGMFSHGKIFGETAAEKKMLRDGWMPG